MPGVVVTRAHINRQYNVNRAAFLLGLGRCAARFLALAHAPVQRILSRIVACVLLCRCLAPVFSLNLIFKDELNIPGRLRAGAGMCPPLGPVRSVRSD